MAAHPRGTMKAIVQDGYGSADVLRLREVEKPLVSDQDVLVRVRAASVNALDWHVVRGGPFLHMMAFLLRQPKITVRGVDVAEHVEAVGKNVTRIKPGAEVFGSARGGFAEDVAAREDRFVPRPHRPPIEQATAVGIADV